MSQSWQCRILKAPGLAGSYPSLKSKRILQKASDFRRGFPEVTPCGTVGGDPREGPQNTVSIIEGLGGSIIQRKDIFHYEFVLC